MSTSTSFKGVFPIMATPFDASERLDVTSFAKSIRFMKEAGCDGVTVVGVLGESNRLLDVERDELVRVAVDAAEDMPVIVGTSHAYVFFNPHSYSHLFNKSDIHTTYMHKYSSPLYLVIHILLHTLTQAIMHTYVTLEPQVDQYERSQ